LSRLLGSDRQNSKQRNEGSKKNKFHGGELVAKNITTFK
jgi:hypothetical protein